MTRHPIAQIAPNGNPKSQETSALLPFSREIDYFSRRVSLGASTLTRFFTDDSELVSAVTVFTYDPVRAAFIWQQTISVLPPDFTGTNTAAEIRIHPSGRFLYTTNRGHNSVATFEIEQGTGDLEVIGWESTRGEWPLWGANVPSVIGRACGRYEPPPACQLIRSAGAECGLRPAAFCQTPSSARPNQRAAPPAADRISARPVRDRFALN